MKKRWPRRIILALLVAFVAAYVADLAVFKLRGSPTSDVSVNRYLTVPLKGNRREFDPLGIVHVPCSVSLFPQRGLDPCWQVRRQAKEDVPL
ncbi:MAG TPA: hypothetical protein VFI20_05395 [Terracidiphilus sp.]|nr:hypothetical protein [Terracidiphilus sp.]